MRARLVNYNDQIQWRMAHLKGQLEKGIPEDSDCSSRSDLYAKGFNRGWHSCIHTLCVMGIISLTHKEIDRYP